MPLWNQSAQDEKKQRLDQEKAEAEISRKSLESGGLPLKAQQRLSEKMKAEQPLFTSNLSTNEFLLIHQQGYEPLSQVMGCSFYHVGRQYLISNSVLKKSSATPFQQELTVLSEAHQRAARLALGRLRQEATLLKAHGVIGVRFTRRKYGWGRHMLEYTAIGTAVRLSQGPPPSRPFLSDLSGQDFWKLLQAGYYPAGVVTGYCSYYVALGYTLGQKVLNWLRGGINNQELAPFAQGVATARQIALRRATAMARDVNARGIVGVQVEIEREMSEYETEEPRGKSLGLTVHFAVIGTAILGKKKSQAMPIPQSTLTLTKLRPEPSKQDQELTLNEE